MLIICHGGLGDDANIRIYSHCVSGTAHKIYFMHSYYAFITSGCPIWKRQLYQHPSR